MTYQEYFKNKLKQRGISSPMQLDQADRKKFFDDIKTGWNKQSKKVVESYLLYLNEAGFEKMPKGWTKKSVKKAGNTIAKDVGETSPKDKGFFDKCVEKMKGDINNPEGYCASLKDESYGSTYWRGKGKTKKQAKKLIVKYKNV